MQLKTIGESLNEASAIKEVLSKYDSDISEGKNQYLIIQELKKATKDYTTEATKRAIIETTLNEKQINQILSSKGLKGEILETTTAELANITATNSLTVAESGMTTVTISLKNAFKGLWATIGGFVAAHPILAITASIGAGIAAFIKISDMIITTYNEASEKLDDCRNKLNNASSDVENAKSKLDSINESIKEIQDKGTLSLTDQEDLDRLKKEKEELERTLEIYKEKECYAKKDTEDSAVKKLTDSKYTSKNDMYSYKTDENGDIKQTNLGLVTYDSVIDYYQALKIQYEEQQKYLDWINDNHPDWSDTVIDRVKNSLSATKEEMADILVDINDSSDSLYGVTDNGKKLKNTISDMNLEFEIFRYKIGETSFDDLTNSAKKLVAALRLEDNNSKNQIMDYLNSLSDEDFSLLVKSNVTFDENTTVENLKETIKAAQEEANKSSVDLSVKTFDPTSLLTESDDKSKDKATLADLQSEADLLSSIQKEMSETGRIGVDSMQKIIKQYPEAKNALSEYMAGLIDEQELFAQLEQVYEDDKNAYVDKIYEQMETTTQFLENISQDYPDFFDFLSNLYQDDLGNYTTVAELKKEIDTALVSALDSLWRGHYQLIQDKATGLYSAIIDDQAMLDGTISEEESDNILNGISDEVERANSALTRLNEIKNSYVNQISDNASWQSLGKDLSSSSDSSSGSDSSSEPSPQDFNWVERLLSKISKAYDRLKNKVSDTTRTWLNRNNALSDSMETLLSEINAQSDAYDFYMDKFNSYDLSDYYKDQIANGSFNIETVYDDDLKDAISDCQDLYDKAQDAADAVQSLNIEIRQLAKSRFDNIQSQFEGVIGKITAIRDLYGKEDDLMQSQGWFASTLLNNSMMEQEQKNLAKLEQERDALTKALNSAVSSGKIAPESEDWYSMQASIDDCSSSIFDAKKALVEYDNAIRQINWDAFDRTRDDVSNLIDETEFLVGLLKDKGITDDNGNMNDNGKAAQALIAQKYQLYLNQAKAYKDEILKIDEELSKDPYDKELLDRKQELIKAQQDAVNSSISEKDALKDLVKEGYDTFLDKLDEVIQKYKDLMSQQKDAYDYEKSIAEKTKALNALEKQYSAVQGDNSEEGKKNIQQLKDQINTAKDDLKDTEYEKLISDTQAILDNLADTTKTWLDERLDSFDITMQEIIEQSNANASNIADTITSTANDYGIKLSESMSSIWSTNASNITNGINSVLGDFSNKFVEGNNAINKVCGDINAAVQGLLKNSNDEAQRVADEIARQQAEQNANTNGGYSDGGGSSDSGDDWSDNWDNSDSGSSDDSGSDGVNWIYSPDDFPKDELDISSSIVDRIKWHDYDSSFAARSQYYDQMGGEGQYYGTYDQNVFMLDWMKNNGYRKGTKSATSGVHIYDEDNPGSEVIVTKYGTLRQFDSGDTVFSKEQVQKLWDMSKGITALTPNMGLSNIATKLPDIPANSKSMSNKVDVSYGDVSLSFPNVHNYEDFMKQAQQDPKFEKMVQNMTLGQTLGRNSLSKLTFR